MFISWVLFSNKFIIILEVTSKGPINGKTMKKRKGNRQKENKGGEEKEEMEEEGEGRRRLQGKGGGGRIILSPLCVPDLFNHRLSTKILFRFNSVRFGC